MNDAPPDFFMSSTEHTGEWSRPRACWLKARVTGPYHDQYALIEVDPAVVKQDAGAALTELVISPHSVGTTIFPPSGSPIRVYVYEIRNAQALGTRRIATEDVELVAWCELYSTRREAEQVSRASTA